MHLDFALPVDGDLEAGIQRHDKQSELAVMDYSYHVPITEWNDKVIIGEIVLSKLQSMHCTVLLRSPPDFAMLLSGQQPCSSFQHKWLPYVEQTTLHMIANSSVSCQAIRVHYHVNVSAYEGRLDCPGTAASHPCTLTVAQSMLTSLFCQVSSQMANIVKKGITSFKFFMAYKGALMVGDELLLDGLQRCKQLGALAMVRLCFTQHASCCLAPLAMTSMLSSTTRTAMSAVIAYDGL